MIRKNKYSRRTFLLKNLIGSVTIFGGSGILAAFKLVGPASPASLPQLPSVTQTTAPPIQPGFAPTQQGTPQIPKKSENVCDDLTGIAPGEIEKRRKFAYVNQSPIPDSRCGNCKLFLPPGTGKACGGCLLFKGPVRETGYCTYWAPTEE